MRLSLVSWLLPVCLLCTALAQQGEFYVHSGDHVLFYGDSITEQRMYDMITETYVLTRYPSMKVDFTNSGWGGDRVSGGGGGTIDVRLKRDLFAYKPTIVTIMLGMNDGGYQPATEESDKRFFDGLRHIVQSIKQTLPQTRITVIAPSPYDNVTRPSTFPVTGTSAYNEVLEGYGRWLMSYGQQNGLTVADANTEFVHMLEHANQQDPALAKQVLPDRVHPGFGGHMMIAEALLKSWNARPVVAAVTIDASGSRPVVKASEHAVVTGLETSEGVSWSEMDDALPLPFAQWQDMWNGGPTVALAINNSDIAEALNQEPLKVTGLKRGVYSLRIDGKSIGIYSDDHLAMGVNLAMLKTPMTDQAMSVYELTSEHGDIHYDRWRHIQVPFEADQLTPTSSALSLLDTLETALVEKQRLAAVPKQHVFAIVPVN